MTQPPRKILIAVDGSSTSLYSLEWYKEWFLKERDEIVIFHCSEPDSFTKFFKSSGPLDRVYTSLELIQYLQEMLENSPFKGTILNVVSSKPGEAIIKACDENKMDMVIIGARGTRPISKRHTVGSTAQYVMQNLRLPTILCQIPVENKK